jgi:hypothetical protein
MSRQSGEGRLGCIVGLLIFAAAVLVAYKMIPVKVKAADLRDTITSESRAAGSRTDAAILNNILYKAKELNLPVGKEDIEIRRGGQAMRIRVKYTVPVEFPGYTHLWKFEHYAENPIF